MQTAAVVSAEVPADDLDQCRIAVERQGMNDLGFHGMPEGLHEGVVGQLARSVHALHDLQRREVGTIGMGGILDPTIRMEDESRHRFAPSQGPVQGDPRQRQVAPGSQTPAQDATRVTVHDHGQIAPLATDFQIRHVADPDLIGGGGRALQNPVGNCGEKVARPWHVPVDTRRACLQASFTHQAGYALASHAGAGLRQGRLNAGCPVGAFAGFEDCPYARGQVLIVPLVRTGAAGAPGVVARARDAVTHTQRLYAKPVLLRLDEREDGAL